MQENRQTTSGAIDRSDIERVENMGKRELDELPFGAIQLDKQGVVLAFNQHEARLTGRKKEAVLGKNFFTEVAPCTNVQEFAGRFREGVEHGELHAVFPYRFDYEMDPRNVWVTLFYSESTDTAWVFVREQAAKEG